MPSWLFVSCKVVQKATPVGVTRSEAHRPGTVEDYGARFGILELNPKM